MKKIFLTETQLIQLIEAEVVKVKKSELKNDWDAKRIVNLRKRNKHMFIKTKEGYFKEIRRRSGQTKVYFLTKKDSEIANKLVDQINKLKSKLNDILK